MELLPTHDPQMMAAYSAALKGLFKTLGIPADDDGITDTPARILRAWEEMTAGLREEPPKMTWFDSRGADELVIVTDIQFSSMCIHHFFPFWGRAHVAYLPHGKIIGLSKIARLVRYWAQRPQTQEHLAQSVANALMVNNVQGVYILTEAEHSCMSCRGAKSPGSSTIVGAVRGTIDRNEVLSLISLRKGLR